MGKVKSSEITPCGINLLVSIKVTDKEIKGVKLGKQFASKTNVEFYMGQVLKLGKDATNKEQCPGLQEGDFVMFNQFSGAVAATSDNYTKVILGYDVVAISKEEDMNKETIIPANDRILIEVLNENLEINGVKVEDTLDPRDKQTQRGVVLKLGSNADSDVKVGDVVFIDPYTGNLIVNDSDLKLKVVNYRDILYKI